MRTATSLLIAATARTDPPKIGNKAHITIMLAISGTDQDTGFGDGMRLATMRKLY